MATVVFCLAATVAMVKKVCESRKVPALLAAKDQLVAALRDHTVPSHLKQRPDGQLRQLIGEVQRVLDELAFEEAQCLLRRIETTQTAAIVALEAGRLPVLDRINAVEALISVVRDVISAAYSKRWLVPALYRAEYCRPARDEEEQREILSDLLDFVDRAVYERDKLRASPEAMKAADSARQQFFAHLKVGNVGAMRSSLRMVEALHGKAYKLRQAVEDAEAAKTAKKKRSK